MDPREYERIFNAELTHWWYRGMQSITHAMLKRFIHPLSGMSILDAGCGTGGAIASTLADYGKVTGLDLSPLALKGCQARRLPAIALASVTDIPFASGAFDLVTSFDVLYERAVKNDACALSEFSRVLLPGGYILLRLPAYDWLRGQHDSTVHTARRYTAWQVARLLRAGGFDILHISYANTLLFPLAVAKRMLERVWPPASGSSDLDLSVGAFNDILSRILSSEAFLITHPGLPFGLSVIALGQKTKTS